MGVSTSLAPGLLIAAPPLANPIFDQSVVLLASHGSDGAFGWVINGKKVMSLADLLAHTNLDLDPRQDDYSLLDGPVRLGGPVGQEQVWLLFRTNEWHEPHAPPSPLATTPDPSSMWRHPSR